MIHTMAVVWSIISGWWQRYSGCALRYNWCEVRYNSFDVMSRVLWCHKSWVRCRIHCILCHIYSRCDVINRVYVITSIECVWSQRQRHEVCDTCLCMCETGTQPSVCGCVCVRNRETHSPLCVCLWGNGKTHSLVCMWNREIYNPLCPPPQTRRISLCSFSFFPLFHLQRETWFFGDFTGGPVVQTPRSQCRGNGSDPWWENQDPTLQKKKATRCWGPVSAGSRGYPQDERHRRERRHVRPALTGPSLRGREREREWPDGVYRVWQCFIFLP